MTPPPLLTELEEDEEKDQIKWGGCRKNTGAINRLKFDSLTI